MTSPFATIGEALRSSAPAVIILRGTPEPYAGPIELNDGQQLIGDGTTVPVITAERDVITIARGASVTVTRVVIRATSSAKGIVAADAGTITLRDVEVTTTGGAGLSVRNAARLVVTGSRVASVDGPALDLRGIDLDASFQSVSAHGQHLSRGIVVEQTTGRFSVEGLEERGSGGTIEGASTRAVSVVDASNITLKSMRIVRSAAVNGVASPSCGADVDPGADQWCNAAVYMRDVSDATLDNVVIEGSGQAGIALHRVDGFGLSNSEVLDAGDEIFEHGIMMVGVSGEIRLSGTKISRSESRHLMVRTTSGRTKLIVEQSIFSDTEAPNGQQAILVSASKKAAIDIRVEASAFAHHSSHAIDVIGADEARVSLIVTKSTFETQAAAVSVSATGAAAVDYVIADNPSIRNSAAAAINVYLGTPSTGRISGVIARNTFGRSGVVRSGTSCNSCAAVSLTAAGYGSLVSEISGNVIQQVGSPAVVAVAGPGGAGIDLSVTSNLFREPVTANAVAIRVSAAGLPTDSTRACADLGGTGAMANTIEGSGWDATGPIQLLHRFGGSRFQLAGLSKGKSDIEAAAAVAARNRGTSVRTVLRAGSQQKGFEPASNCEMPLFPQ